MNRPTETPRWLMPSETAPQDRVWMSFPRPGVTLGESGADRAAGYATWSAVAAAVADFESVTMLVDPAAADAAKEYLRADIEVIEAPVGEFWMRDTGPTFVHGEDGGLGAVNWVFNGWGDNDWADWRPDRDTAATVAARAGATLIDSALVNEGGGIHTDGQGTLLLTETVQLDPRRNPGTTKAGVEAEMERVLGATHPIWLPRGLYRDTLEFGTNGHVDIVATLPRPGTLLLHAQPDPGHPDHEIMGQIREALAGATDAAGRALEIVELPAPETIEDAEGPVDYSYINHLVVNGGVIACGFGEDRADARAREILASVYPGRKVVTVDARELFARGGGIHCITQHQPSRLDALDTRAAGTSA
ncbi:MAG: agmatine deiminase family protein [Galactobacter sp.]